MDITVGCTEFTPAVGDIIDGKYRVESYIGEGSFGNVYKVTRPGRSQPLALKIVRLWDLSHPRRYALRTRLDQDYQSSLIRNDYLVQSYDKGIINGNPYIVSEYYPGGSLLEASGINSTDLSKKAVEVLFGLKALHANGKVHCDLKPQNVLLRKDGRTALSDFGIIGTCNYHLATNWRADMNTARFEAIAYIAPELLADNGIGTTVLPAVDIFSFGVMMYKLLTGFLPFGPLNDPGQVEDYVMRASKGDWDSRKLTYSPNLREWIPVIQGCLQPNPAKRFNSIDAVLALMPLDSDSKQPGQAANVSNAKNGYCLRVMQGEQFGYVFYLDRMAKQSGRRVITLGRNDVESHNFISIRESQSCFVSRRQCTFEQDIDTGRWLLRDGQWDVKSNGRWRPSRNGTSIGSQKVDSNGIEISLGDVISFGDIKLRVEGY